MSSASEEKSSRYSLRPKVGAFDLCINRNRYGLIRTIVGRRSEPIKNESLTPDSSPCSSPCSSPDRCRSRSRSSSPSLNNNKRKFRLEAIENFDAKKMCNVSPATTAVIVPKKWQPPVRAPAVRKPPPTLYDVSKAAYFRELNEICLFEIFNHLSLNDICVMGDVCTQLKFAAQKYFDVMYTAVNLAWLSDDESGQFTLVQAERLLRNFGHLISTITVNTKQLKAPDCKENLLILIEKYCDGILFWNTY